MGKKIRLYPDDEARVTDREWWSTQGRRGAATRGPGGAKALLVLQAIAQSERVAGSGLLFSEIRDRFFDGQSRGGRERSARSALDLLCVWGLVGVRRKRTTFSFSTQTYLTPAGRLKADELAKGHEGVSNR